MILLNTNHSIGWDNLKTALPSKALFRGLAHQLRPHSFQLRDSGNLPDADFFLIRGKGHLSMSVKERLSQQLIT